MTADRNRSPERAGTRQQRRRTARARWRLPMAVAAVAGLAAIGLVAAPAQAQAVICADIVIENTTVGSVSVPGGTDCHLRDVVVLGATDVGAAAGLFMERTVAGPVTAAGGAELLLTRTVAGAVTAGAGAFVSADGGSVVTGGLTLNEAFGALLVDSVIFQGVQVNGSEPKDNTRLLTERTDIAGNVRSSWGWTVLVQGFVNGFVDTGQDVATDLVSMQVAGTAASSLAAPQDVAPSGVKVRSTIEDGSVVCDTRVNGDLDIRHGTGGVIQIGGPFPDSECLGTIIRDDLQLHSSTMSEIQISANTIFGDANCTGNAPTPVGHGNIIFGTASGQCANLGQAQQGLIPPPGTPGEREAVSVRARIAAVGGPLEDRLTDARARLGTLSQ